MRILVVERYGSLLSLVMRLENEGNQVAWYIGDEEQRDVGDGLVGAEKPSQWSPCVQDADLILLAGYPSHTTKALQKQGKQVIGGQFDALFTAKLATAAGLKVAKADQKGEKTYCGAWFNGYKFVSPLFINKKHYGLMANGEGPDIFMGLEGRFQGKHPLFHEVLRKLGVFLKANRYTGYVECKTIRQNGRYYFGGMTSNLSNPSILLQMELIREDLGNFLYRLAEGKTKNIKTMSRYAAGVQVWTLPCPLSYMTGAFNGIPVEFPHGWAHIHPVQVKKVDELVTAGTSGNVCQCVGHALTPEVALERALNMITMVNVKDKMYRDIRQGELRK